MRDVGNATGQIPDISSFTIQKATSGWQKLPSGLIIQWGTVDNGGSGTAGSTTLPIAFPSSFNGLTFGPMDSVNGGFTVACSSRTLNSFTAVIRDVSNAAYPHVPARLQTAIYWAFGY